MLDKSFQGSYMGHIFISLVRIFLVEGLTRAEPAVSRACGTGPGPYLLIGILWVIGRIYKPKLNIPT